ncbi:hypothetical protein [Bifidobacterium avesanii]|uniref:hypothetical protein n=1 Tax=Bifidobacterium avesanii TaxID=1798157 RepID=UPI00137F8F9E|nr:hypothetical protein [Bifidobacterium avesanii]KAB8291472.1 hypothetical protein DSM100685_1190 [Bifidobacterium avesanii]
MSQQREFTPEEIAYLEGLAAVESATPTRINYEKWFARDCLRRNMRGEGPTKLFIEAGLPPALIGRKRIERCFARWRSNADRVLAWKDEQAAAKELAKAAAWEPLQDPDEVMTLMKARRDESADPRDLLIIRQVQQIGQLEHEVEELKAELKRALANGEHVPCA